MGSWRDEPFVGRTRELDLITGALHAPATDRARLICISGPAGIGKTTLAARAIDQVDAPALWTRCWNGPGTPALWPWTQVLRPLGIESSTAPKTTGSTADRFAQFDHISAELCSRNRNQPIFIVIDDIQWADRASLELLHFVARASRSCDLAIIATYRAVEAHSGPDREIIAAITREAHHVRLEGLRPEEIDEIAASLGIRARSTIDSVERRAGGNPFFARELLLQLSADPTEEQRLPDGVQTLLGSQLDLLDATTRGILELAAVQGDVFDPTITSAAADMNEPDALTLLGRAENVRLLRRRDDQWTFAHALVAEALLASRQPHELAQRHLAVADAIESFAAPNADDDSERSETLAKHLAAAGPLAAAERLHDAAVRAATVARQRLAFESESHFLRVAIDALGPGPEPARRSRLHAARCIAEKALGNFDEARSAAALAATCAHDADDPVAFAQAALVYPPDAEGVELDQVHDPEQGRLREEALTRLPDHEDLLRAQLQAAHAMSLYWSVPPGEFDRFEPNRLHRDRLTADALATAERHGDTRTLAIAVRARLYANWGPDTDEERPALARRLVEVANDLGDERLALEGRVWRVSERLQGGRLLDAEAEIDAFEDGARRLHDRYQKWTALRLRSNLHFMRGDLEGAERINAEAFEFGSTFLPNDAPVHFYSAALGPITFLRGSMGTAVDFIRDTAAQNPHVPAWRIGYALASAENGDHDTARHELDAIAADGLAMMPRDLDFVTSLCVAAAAAQKVGHVEMGRMIAEQLKSYSGLLVVHGVGYTSYGSFDLILGECAEARGDTEEAVRLYRSAIGQLDPTGSLYAAYARLLLAELVAVEEPGHSRRLLGQARTSFERVGADAMVSRIDTALAEIDRRRTVRLVHDGNHWSLHRPDAAPVRLPALKGFRPLQELLTHPHEVRHALVLSSLLDLNGNGSIVVEGRVELADDAAIAAYRARVDELRSLLDDADRRGDVERSDELTAELQAIGRELERVGGFAGRVASAPGAADRARVNVTKHLKRAVERIGQADPVLGRALRESVETGMHCCHRPPDGSTIVWSG